MANVLISILLPANLAESFMRSSVRLSHRCMDSARILPSQRGVITTISYKSAATTANCQQLNMKARHAICSWFVSVGRMQSSGGDIRQQRLKISACLLSQAYALKLGVAANEKSRLFRNQLKQHQRYCRDNLFHSIAGAQHVPANRNIHYLIDKALYTLRGHYYGNSSIYLLQKQYANSAPINYHSVLLADVC